MRGTEALLQNTPLLHFSWREEGRERRGEESETAARGREIQPEPIFLLSASDGAQTESREGGRQYFRNVKSFTSVQYRRGRADRRAASPHVKAPRGSKRLMRRTRTETRTKEAARDAAAAASTW